MSQATAQLPAGAQNPVKDPVCGMNVNPATARYSNTFEGSTFPRQRPQQTTVAASSLEHTDTTWDTGPGCSRLGGHGMMGL